MYEVKQVTTDWENNSQSQRTQEVRQVRISNDTIGVVEKEQGVIPRDLAIPTSNASIVSDQ